MSRARATAARMADQTQQQQRLPVDAPPCESVASVAVPVGPYEYQVVLVDEDLSLNGRGAVAICDGDRQEIRISRRFPPHVRLARFWHELGHAIQFECDPREAGSISGEALANLFALGLARLTPEKLAEIRAYLLQEVMA